MREIVLGTAGHVDHGKTSLVRALTGIETDRLKEEKKRGITIELGFAYLDLPCGHRLGIVDVPGHEKFVRNMVAGVTGMDILAFIIAADEGIMPQTREHFEICRLLGVKQGLVIITKKDLVEEDWLEMVDEEVRSFCQGSFLEDAPLVHVSSTTGEGLDQVIEVIDGLVRRHNFNEVFGPFRLPVDRSFAMKGFGSVITGTSVSGRIGTGEDVRLYPSRITAKIRGIQVHSQTVEQVEAGHRTAVNLQGVDSSEVSRGMVAATPGVLEPNYMLDCEFLYLGSGSRPLPHRSRVRVNLGTSEVPGRISLLDRDELLPGDECGVQLLLEEPAAVWPGDRFVVRSYSPVTTIGGGQVLGNVSPVKRKRLSDKDRQYNQKVIATLKNGSLTEKVVFFLEESKGAGLDFDAIGIRLGLFGKHLKKALADPLSARQIIIVDSASQLYMASSLVSEIEESVVETIKEYHRNNPLKTGISKEELRTGHGRHINPKVYSYVLNNLLKSKVIVQEDSVVRLAEHQVALKADEKQLQRDLTAWHRNKGLFAPTIKETMAEFADYNQSLVREVMEMLIREEQLVKVSESLYFDHDALHNLIMQVQEYLVNKEEIDAPAFKELSGLTRKFSIPILEYLDKIKLTVRVGDKRVLRRKITP
ncbi:MAG: selenocysteine-specific translation elongation factor [Deltaproteobacteria bacterium]|nr:MAG: selenocysteine-specific translation elongation factor [Deltaproteobacteria bacterium]